MEQMLLSPRAVILKKQGIPLTLIQHLVRGSKFYDVNLKHGSGGDCELNEINALEQSLGALSPEQIEKRIAADFCCIWRYDYADRVHQICSIIGGSSAPGLRLHYQICPARRQELMTYAEALKGWLMDVAPDALSDDEPGTVKKVYRLLGRQDPLKKLIVERTYIGLSERPLNCSFWGSNAADAETCLYPCNAQELDSGWQQRMAFLERSIQKEMGRAAGDFLCDVGGSAEPACHFKFIRRIDILVSSIGCLKWRGNLPAKDHTITGRRQITGMYLDILESYWNGKKSEYAHEGGAQLKNELFGLLGEPDDVKRWLVACLWKNIKNQTAFHAYPMKHWVEFVRIGEDYIDTVSRNGRR